jgi:hypothetical protein
VLRELAGALAPGAEVVIVPGNHDHHLLDPWLERRARDGAGAPPLSLETEVVPSPGDPIHELADALAPAAVRVAYPGVWLRGDVYATHGHYADRHTTVPMLERLAAGLMARIVTQPADGPGSIEDYESTLAPVYAWIHALGQTMQAGSGTRGASARVWHALAGSNGSRGVRRWRRHGMAVAFPALVWSLNRAGIGPLRPQLSPAELRRAGLRAMREVSGRLGIDAGYVVFGHTHRAGPLAHDDGAEWAGPAGQRLLNSGCWVLEPAFLGSRPLESPYRAGFAVRLEGEAPPELTNLLDPPAGRAPV